MALLAEEEGNVSRELTFGRSAVNLDGVPEPSRAGTVSWIRARDIAIALSLSNLAFLPVWSQLIGDSLDERASYGLASTHSFLAVIINISILAAVFYLTKTVLRRTNKMIGERTAQALFWLLFLFSMTSVAQSFVAIRGSLSSTIGGLSGFNYVLLSCCAVAVCISAWFRRRNATIGALLVIPFVLIGNAAPLSIALILAAFGILLVVMWNRSMRRAASIVALALFPFVPMTLFQTTWLINEFKEKAPATIITATRSTPRIVWIIFDELDYKISFEQRPAKLELPEMDRLRGDSIFATNAYPPADYTLMSMPALISGRLVASTKPKNPSTLMVTFSDSAESVSWSSQSSVFSKARDLGVNSAIVGWYHPYCRIIGDQVVSCMSCNTGRSSLPVTSASQFLTAVRENVLVPEFELLDTSDGDRRRWREELLQSYREILQASREAVLDPDIGLVLLHFPVPHPPGIFDRESNEFDTDGDASYLDDLKLADNTLADLRRAMEQAGLWENSVVVLSSDHWWRGDLWRHMRDSRAWSWTAEDEAVFSDVDERIPFIVKPAGHHTSINYTREFNTVLTHDLFLALLNGSLSDTASVVDWLDTHRSIGKSPYKYKSRR